MAVLHNSPFTGAAGTAVNTLTPTVGNALVNVTATATTDGTRMRRPNSNGTVRVRTADAFGSADYSVTCVVNSLAPSSPNIIEIAGRYVDTNNHYFLEFVQSLGQIRLRKRVSGTASTLTGGTGTWTWTGFTHGVDYTVRLRMEGSAITGWVDGVQRVSGTDTSFTSAGAASVLLTGNTGTTPDTEAFRVDSLLVEDFVVGGGGGGSTIRRRTILKSPSNTYRAFKSYQPTRFLFGAPQVVGETPTPPPSGPFNYLLNPLGPLLRQDAPGAAVSISNDRVYISPRLRFQGLAADLVGDQDYRGFSVVLPEVTRTDT